MILTKDYFNNPIVPNYALCKANKEIIGVVSCGEKTLDIKFNDLNEIHFTTYMNVDNKKNPYYELTDIMKYILLPDIGFFYISDCNTQSEGTDFEYKEVTAKSYEGLMAQKYLENFIINRGTVGSIDGVSFCNIGDKEHSLLHIILGEKCPDWKIGHIDTELYTMQRSFEIDRQDVYSFLMNDVSTAFECVFLFDTLTNTINIYQEKNVGEDTDIHVSYNNLLESTNISCSMDDIKTCLTITGADELNIREINMGFDRIYSFDAFNSTEYMSEGLYNSYNAWIEIYNNNFPQYTTLLSQYQNYYIQINYLTHEKMPDDTESTDWTLYGLNPLKEKLSVYEQKQAVSMKVGHGNVDSQYYQSEYLPIYNTINDINFQISKVNNEIELLKSSQNEISTQMATIINAVAMENNFTKEQLAELSTFIREDELNSENFIVTDIMSDDERFDMLNAMLEFGKEELQKISTPQLSFNASMANIFVLPEFDKLHEKFDVGNYIWVSLRDDYHIKAKLLTIHINFHDKEDFSVSFGNITRKAKTRYTDVSEMIKAGASAATSVSFNSSYWSEAYRNASNIGQMLADGLLSAGNYLSSGDDSEMIIDSRGIFVNTTSGEYAYKDSIFMGGGRILFTDDNWKSVAMAVGRATVNGESRFGTFADFCIASYIAGSTMEGGTITGTVFNNGNGTFLVDENGNLTANSANIKGNISASKVSGSEITGSSINNGNGTFSVDENGKLTASDANITKGTIGGAVIANNSLHSTNNNWSINSDGSASFSNIKITGASSSGSFGGGFSANTSFGLSGGALTNFNDLVANKVTASYIDATVKLSATYAEIKTVNAVSARVGTIESDYVKAATINAMNATINGKASIGDLNATNAIVSGKLDASEFNATNISAMNITVKSANVTGGFNANKITAGTLSVDRLDVDGIVAGLSGKSIQAETMTCRTSRVSSIQWYNGGTGQYDSLSLQSITIGGVTYHLLGKRV